MKSLSLVLLLVMAGCSSTKYYAPEVVKPVRRAVAVTRIKVVEAQEHGKKASESLKALTEKLPVETPELHDLALKTKLEVDALTQSLIDANLSLDATEATVNALEATAGKIIAEREQAIKEKSILERRYGKLKFALATFAAAVGGYFLFQFKSILAFAGPYAWIAFVVGPSTVFALVWWGLDWIL